MQPRFLRVTLSSHQTSHVPDSAIETLDPFCHATRPPLLPALPAEFCSHPGRTEAQRDVGRDGEDMQRYTSGKTREQGS